MRREPGVGTIDGVEPSAVVYREEVVATMFLIADVNAELGRIVALLEGEENGEEGLPEDDS